MRRVVGVVLGLLLLAVVTLIIILWNPIRSLRSLSKVDDHPLVVMRWYGGYDYLPYDHGEMMDYYHRFAPTSGATACSLYAAHKGGTSGLLGRNYDWSPSPTLVLLTDPPDAFSSISIVDLQWLGFRESHFSQPLPWLLKARFALTPIVPFDGMNEKGLAIGMALVDDSPVPRDDSKRTIGGLVVIREILDRASTVDEAIEIFRQNNIEFEPGPQLHYLIADASGNSAVVELFDSSMKVLPNSEPWHAATNFYLSPEKAPEDCRRYDTLTDTLRSRRGELTPQGGLDLLKRVKLSGRYATQWSAVYDLGRREVDLTVGGQYEKVHRFSVP